MQIGQRIGIGEKAFRVVSTVDREVTAAVSATELEQLQQAEELFFQTPDEKLPIRFRAASSVVSGSARTREARFVFTDPNPLPIGKTGRVVWGGQQP
ncbi:MAG: hypothetical protein R3E89_19810 [Thiolinea sp.]